MKVNKRHHLRQDAVLIEPRGPISGLEWRQTGLLGDKVFLIELHRDTEG